MIADASSSGIATRSDLAVLKADLRVPRADVKSDLAELRSDPTRLILTVATGQVALLLAAMFSLARFTH